MQQKLNPIPEGYHTITPYVIVSDGAAALEFYAKVFHAEVKEQMADASTGRVRHAELKIGTSMVMMGEHAPAEVTASAELPTVSLYLYVEDVDAVFDRAVAGGASVMAPPDTKFYGNRECGVKDPFGIVWWIASRVEDVGPEELAKRAAAQAPPSA